jgi:hypothetical protein
MTTTRLKVTSGHWGSVQGGKWHRTVEPQPHLYERTRALCGITFEPLNVVWNDAPPTSDRFICEHCHRQHLANS